MGIFTIDDKNYCSFKTSARIYCDPKHIKTISLQENHDENIVVFGPMVDGVKVYSFENGRLTLKSSLEDKIFSAIGFSKIDKDSSLDLLAYNIINKKLELFFNNGINEFVKYKDYFVESEVLDIKIWDSENGSQLFYIFFPNKISIYTFDVDYDLVEINSFQLDNFRNKRIYSFAKYDENKTIQAIIKDEEIKEASFFYIFNDKQTLSLPFIKEKELALYSFDGDIQKLAIYDKKQILFFSIKRNISFNDLFFIAGGAKNSYDAFESDSAFIFMFSDSTKMNFYFVTLNKKLNEYKLIIDKMNMSYDRLRYALSKDNKLLHLFYYSENDFVFRIAEFDISANSISELGTFYYERKIFDVQIEKDEQICSIKMLAYANDTLSLDNFILNRKRLFKERSQQIFRGNIIYAKFSNDDKNKIYFASKDKINYVFYQTEMTSSLLLRFRSKVLFFISENSSIYNIIENMPYNSRNSFLTVFYKLEDKDCCAYSNGKIHNVDKELSFSLDNVIFSSNALSLSSKNILVYDKSSGYFFKVNYMKNKGLFFSKIKKKNLDNIANFCSLNEDKSIIVFYSTKLPLFKFETLQ